MKARAFASALLLTSVTVLSGCSAPSPEQTAQCHFESATPQERFDRAALAEPFYRDACLGLGLGASLAASVGSDESYQGEVIKAYNELAARDPDHLAGRYASIVLKHSPLSAEGARAAGELGMFMADVAFTRSASLQCGVLDGDALYTVGEVDSLFVLASLGHSAKVSNPEAGKLATGELIQAAATDVLKSVPPACNEALVQRLEGHLLAWKQFYEGNHPWTGDCRPEVTENEFVLRCGNLQ